jgi:hypothetical protein
VNDVPILIALGTGLTAIMAWLLLLIRMAVAYLRREERRSYIMMMPVVGFLASLGGFASALGFALGSGWSIPIERDTITQIASMGRGALFMGGLLALGFYRPNGGGSDAQ